MNHNKEDKSKNPKNWWNLVKQFYKDQNLIEQMNHPLLHEDKIIENNKEKAEIAENLKKNIWPLIANNIIKLHIDKKFDIDDVSKAHQYMENNKNIGKLMLNFE